MTYGRILSDKIEMVKLKEPQLKYIFIVVFGGEVEGIATDLRDYIGGIPKRVNLKDIDWISIKQTFDPYMFNIRVLGSKDGKSTSNNNPAIYSAYLDILYDVDLQTLTVNKNRLF